MAKGDKPNAWLPKKLQKGDKKAKKKRLKNIDKTKLNKKCTPGKSSTTFFVAHAFFFDAVDLEHVNEDDWSATDALF